MCGAKIYGCGGWPKTRRRIQAEAGWPAIGVLAALEERWGSASGRQREPRESPDQRVAPAGEMAKAVLILACFPSASAYLAGITV